MELTGQEGQAGGVRQVHGRPTCLLGSSKSSWRPVHEVHLFREEVNKIFLDQLKQLTSIGT